MTVREETQRAIGIWDRMAPRYDAAIALLERIVLRRWRERALREVRGATDILEIGAGTGLNFPLYSPAARVIATDLSIGMLLRAARRKRERIHLVVADAQQLPFHDETFGAAVATLVFCSVPDPALGFAEARRVVRDGSPISIFEHVRPRGILGALFDRLNRLTVASMGDHINRQPAATMRQGGLAVDRLVSGAGTILQVIVARR